jgi:hypothetical protein
LAVLKAAIIHQTEALKLFFPSPFLNSNRPTWEFEKAEGKPARLPYHCCCTLHDIVFQGTAFVNYEV